MSVEISSNSNSGALKLTWEAVVAQFDNLIKFAAGQQVRNRTTDTMISAEDLYQDGMIKLYDCWTKWCVGQNKDMEEFGPIFRTSLFRAMKKSSSKAHQQVFIDLEDAANSLEDLNADDTVERMYRDHGISHLKEMLSTDIARSLLIELAEPSPRTLFEAWADTKRKEMLKSQGKKVNIPKDNTIRMKHIIRSLGITSKQYDVAMAEIRSKAKVALQV
jgi:DNA-directed RNA polymerase specialized sigma24 family protein